MTPKQIIEAIKAERPEINTLFFVGCGASSVSYTHLILFFIPTL